MLETSMKFVEPVWQTDSRFAVHQQEAACLSCSEKEICQCGWKVEGTVSYQSCSALGNSMQLQGVKFLHYKLLKFFSFHENVEPSRNSQIQNNGSLLHVGRHKD